MRVLLDTHVWLWMVAAPERLSKKGRSIVIAAENELVLSAASAWEIAIKFALGRLKLPETPGSYIPRLMARTSVTELPIQVRHALHVATLPKHHRDPFDRVLVAQAQLEDLPILTTNTAFRRYDVKTVRA